MKVFIATKNNTKITGAKLAFEKFFGNVEIEGFSVPSNVPEQPIDDETLIGAKNRVKNLKNYADKNNLSADYYIAIESGMANIGGSYFIVNMAVIEDNFGNQSIGAGPAFPVPEDKVERIKQIGLGDVMNELFNEKELHSRGGGIQLLTHGVVSRVDLTELAFEMALTKFINGELWR